MFSPSLPFHSVEYRTYFRLALVRYSIKRLVYPYFFCKKAINICVYIPIFLLGGYCSFYQLHRNLSFRFNALNCLILSLSNFMSYTVLSVFSIIPVTFCFSYSHYYFRQPILLSDIIFFFLSSNSIFSDRVFLLLIDFLSISIRLTIDLPFYTYKYLPVCTIIFICSSPSLFQVQERAVFIIFFILLRCLLLLLNYLLQFICYIVLQFSSLSPDVLSFHPISLNVQSVMLAYFNTVGPSVRSSYIPERYFRFHSLRNTC